MTDEPREQALEEALARILYVAGPIVPGRQVPTEAWDRLPSAAKRQWLNAATYVLHSLRHHGITVQ